MNPVGKIHQLARYPVKSMRGQSLPATTLTLQGVPEDRRYAFVQTASRSGFPWLTARQMPELLRYKPTVENAEVRGDGGDGHHSRAGRSGRWRVRNFAGRSRSAPAGPFSCCATTAARTMPLPSRSSAGRRLPASRRKAERTENPWRFRPNLLVDLQEGGAFEELNWVGRILRVGDAARVAITEVDQRCVMITLDPESARVEPQRSALRRPAARKVRRGLWNGAHPRRGSPWEHGLVGRLS